MGIPIPTAALGLPWGLNFNPHTHPIPIPMGIPIPTAALVNTPGTVLNEKFWEGADCYRMCLSVISARRRSAHKNYTVSLHHQVLSKTVCFVPRLVLEAPLMIVPSLVLEAPLMIVPQPRPRSTPRDCAQPRPRSAPHVYNGNSASYFVRFAQM